MSLEAALLLGTRQGGAVVPTAPGLIGELLARIPSADREAALLSAAAVLDVCSAAGAEPSTLAASKVDPAPLDDLPAASYLAGVCLQKLLGGEPAGVLGEWLELAAQRGLRAPASILPALLDHAAKHRGDRAAVLGVLGARGRWLALQNPSWSSVVAVESEADFATASHAARLRILAAQRQQDPQHGRELVESAWKEETPQRRAELLSVLRDGLSMADEPFLEDRLAERRKEVRVVAADLLSRIVASRLALRMAARALPLLRFERKGFFASGERIEVRLPETLDDGAARDGVDATRTRPGIGAKAAELIAILGASPLRVWTEAWSVPPARIVAAMEGTTFETALFEGWLLAAERQGNQEWIQALLRHCPPGREDLQLRVVLALPPGRREEEVLTRVVESLDAQALVHPIPVLLAAVDFAWGTRLSQAVLVFLQRYITQEDKLAHGVLDEVFRLGARRLSVDVTVDAARGWPPREHLAPPAQRALERFFAVLDFRRQMHHDLAS